MLRFVASIPRNLAAVRALEQSAAQCGFAAVVFLTDREMIVPGIEARRIPTLEDSAAYSWFVLKELVSHVATEFVLIVQWDGYVLDGSRWEDGFRRFDYIGAPWPWSWIPAGQEVGNGGFSLRSRRLLEVLADEAFEVGHPEDVRICRTWRAELELRRVVFADPDTAARFSVEHGPGSERRFGFHGIFNFWRVVSEAELNGLFDIVSPAALGSSEAMDLVCCYVLRRRGAEARSVLDRYERVHGVDATVAALVEAAAVRGEVMWENLVALLGKRYPGLVG
jgi:hypothetical protein